MNFQQVVEAKQRDTLLDYDKKVLIIILLHLPITMFLIPMGYGTGTFAIVASLVVGVLAGLAYGLLRGSRWFGVVAGVLFMFLSAIMIQSQLGRIEMHFHIFGALALLLIYRDWLPVAAAAGLIAVHHLLFTALQLGGAQWAGMPLTIYDYGCSWGIAFLHAAFVVFEAAFLIYYSLIMRKSELTGMQLMAAVMEVQRDNNLAVRLPDDEGDNEVAVSFNEMLGKIKGLIDEILVFVERLTATSGEILQNSEETSSSIEVQHQQTGQAAAAMAQMAESFQAVADNARGAADFANDAQQQASSGSRQVNQAVQLTTELKGAMEQASDSIRKLEESAASIGSVVDVIRGISEQTNLLALNAAIEAARAGDQGRGFAVVADEVRTLAQRTQESTSEIQHIIETLQRVTGHAVANIGRGQEKTESTVAEIASAGNALREIVDAVAKISSMNQEIAVSVDEQNRSAESISSNIASIADLSQTVVNKVAVNKQAATGLREVAASLQQQISGYRS